MLRPGGAAAVREQRAVGAGSSAVNSSIVLLNLAGVVSIVAGLYFLLIQPSDPNISEALGAVLGPGRTVVNLQRLAIGQALTVAGAVFLAAAWRPRA